MKTINQIFVLITLFLITSCIIQFIPETNENQEVLVVEGLVTDQYGVNTIKLSRSLPLGTKRNPVPLRNCTVEITDDLGKKYFLNEKTPGNYSTNPLTFKGEIGRKYSLYIRTTDYTYRSVQMEILPVSPIDSVYYEKIAFRDPDEQGAIAEGCQIYLDTHDPENKCRYFRWDYSETWEFHIPYSVANRICWKSSKSSSIYIKNTSVFQESRVSKFPLNYISNKTDRLKVKYSILVNQYSLNEDEYLFWEKLQSISDNVGNLYDVTPMAVPSNIYCIENPDEKVLGYFSVSAVSGKRIFIKDRFSLIPNFYSECPSDTVSGIIPNLNVSVWIIDSFTTGNILNNILTERQSCADCRVDGTNVRPVFWTNNK
jgi:hypothetical protein